jgi:hydroxymethylpyrimidine/phosphomethylpyrimidine kinase
VWQGVTEGNLERVLNLPKTMSPIAVIVDEADAIAQSRPGFRAPTLYPGGMQPIALTIAGSDPSGGAGIQADLKTFHQFGVYGEAVIALLTVQNTVRVSRVVVMPPALVLEQLAAVLEDIPPAAAKTGALGSAEMVEAVAHAAADFKFPLVVDPVMVSKHGLSLLPDAAVAAVRELLLPRAFLITPNVPEAEALAGMEIHTPDDMRRAASRLQELGARAVLIKGGHLEGDATDLLFDGAGWHEFPAPRVATPHTHGTGCTYSAAITACLALGLPLAAAVARAKRFIHEAILTNPGLGKGCGPVNHHARVE